MGIEDPLDQPGFHLIVGPGAGTMGRNQLNLLRMDAGLCQSAADRRFSPSAVGSGRGHSIAVQGGAVSTNFGHNGRLALHRLLGVFQNEKGPPLTGDETAPLLIEGPLGFSGRIGSLVQY